MFSNEQCESDTLFSLVLICVMEKRWRSAAKLEDKMEFNPLNKIKYCLERDKKHLYLALINICCFIHSSSMFSEQLLLEPTSSHDGGFMGFLKIPEAMYWGIFPLVGILMGSLNTIL